MGQRSVASATLGFGLVSIPVKLYLTSNAVNVGFNMFTPAGNRVNMVFVDAVTREEIKKGECSHGYEYAKGQYVIFTKEELSALSGDDENGTMDIVEFVPAKELDPLRVEKTFYLDANKGADKAYRVMVKALAKKKQVAVAQWTNRNRQHLVMISARGDALVMHQMFYDNEVRDIEIDAATYEPRDVELNMASQLIDQMSNESFDSSKFKNTFIERVEAAVQNKLAGGAVPTAVIATNNSSAFDLLASLQASLAAPKEKLTKSESESEAPKKAKRAKK